MTITRKYKNVHASRDKVALVIDDLPSVDPRQPRSIRVYGRAELAEWEGMLGQGVYLKCWDKSADIRENQVRENLQSNFHNPPQWRQSKR